MISVVIPAHNEEAVIGRCLSTLLDGAKPGELEVVVVCNACNDRTAEIAARYQGVKVVNTETPGKSNALNLGDEHARAFPRIYLDADITMNVHAARRLGEVLGEEGVMVAAPTMRVDMSKTTAGVRGYYSVWMQLPYYRDRMVGSGVYAMSAEGRAAFRHFPDLLSEDEFIRLMFDYRARRTVEDCEFTVHPPATVRDLLKLRTRWRRGQLQFEGRHQELAERESRSYGGSVTNILGRPSIWAAIPVYLFVWFGARFQAAWQVRWQANPWQWTRDWSARTTGGGSVGGAAGATGQVEGTRVVTQS